MKRYYLILLVFVSNFLFSQTIRESVDGVYTFCISVNNNQVAEAGFLSISDSSYYFELNDYYSMNIPDTTKLPAFMRKTPNTGKCSFTLIMGTDDAIKMPDIHEGMILGFLYFGSNGYPPSDAGNILLVKNSKSNKQLFLNLVGSESNHWELSKYWSRKSMSRQKAEKQCDSTSAALLMKENRNLSQYDKKIKQTYFEENMCWQCYYMNKTSSTAISGFPDFFSIRISAFTGEITVIK